MKRLLARLIAGAPAQGWLYDGSLIVWRRRTDALTAWVRRGRRDDLPGWRAALGPIVRLLILGALAYVLWAIVRAVPWLMWLLAGWWIRAAWKAAKTIPPAAVEDAPHALDAESVRTLLLTLMGSGSAVHLRTVLAHLQKEGHGEGWTVGDLRSRLEALGIPVQDKVKAAGGGPTRGVRRSDLAPSPAEAPGSSTEASTAA